MENAIIEAVGQLYQQTSTSTVLPRTATPNALPTLAFNNITTTAMTVDYVIPINAGKPCETFIVFLLVICNIMF